MYFLDSEELEQILSRYKEVIRWTLILICVICSHLLSPQNFRIDAEAATENVPLKKRRLP